MESSVYLQATRTWVPLEFGYSHGGLPEQALNEGGFLVAAIPRKFTTEVCFCLFEA
jgi:hypothetical protein